MLRSHISTSISPAPTSLRWKIGSDNAPEMQPFRQHYDEALKDGHSLVWYS